jgi:hypothetical protein
MELLSFADSIKKSEQCNKRHLLLGNGFSIACKENIFSYKKLFEQADFSNLSDSIKQVFKEFSTQDFEKIISVLKDSSKALIAYKDASHKLINTLQKDAEGLKELLIHTIAKNHPNMPSDIPHEKFYSCRKFLSNFNNIYTLNYDLLLYWALMHDDFNLKIKCDDGFRTPEDEEFGYSSTYVVWDPNNSRSQNIHFLHGALHLFDTGTEIKKYTWSNTGIKLIDQIRDAVDRNHFPIFVAEGTSHEKLTRIKHNEYLSKAKRSFDNIKYALFIYGHSLAKNDEHILQSIEKNNGLEQVYIGIYGDPNLPSNKQIISRGTAMNRHNRKKLLEINFYSAESTSVWTNSQ